MSFLKFLEGIGDRLGILEAVSKSGNAPTAIQKRTLTLKDLTSEIRSGEVRALAELQAELTIPFDSIFQSAGVSLGTKGWTVDKLQQFVTSEPLRNKSKEEIQKSVLDRLNSDGVPVEEVVRDAIARDQALDSFEAMVRAKMENRLEERHRRIQEIQSQIIKLQEESAELSNTIKAEEEKWREWEKLKRARERELASVLGYIVDHAVISTDADVD
jgi:hypothetical protein